MAIPQQYIEELVARNDIVEYIGGYVQLHRRGRTCSGLCPFHNEKTPSFHVYPENQSFYCFGCGAGGDIITFAKKINNLDYVEAVKLLASRVGMTLPEEEDKAGQLRRRILAINKDTARFFHAQLMAPETGRAARAYWLGRGLSASTIKSFGLGYAPDSFNALRNHLRGLGYQDEELLEARVVSRSEKGNVYDAFRNRVMTPIFDLRGNVIAFGGRVMDDSKPKYINTSETMVYKKSRTLFALNVAKKSQDRRYILCEGYMDVIAMHQAGFTTAVAGCGTALTADHVKLIAQYADEVVLCYDSDGPGQAATAKAINLFKDSGVKLTVLNLPKERAKDPDEFIRKFGGEAFARLLDGSSNVTEYGLTNLRQKYDLTQPGDRVSYLREAADFLATRANPTEREVYAGRIAQEADVARNAVMVQIDSAVRSRGRSAEKKKQQQLLQQGVAGQIKLPYGAGAQALGVAYSEQQLIALLVTGVEDASEILHALSAHTFVDGQMQQLYAVIAPRLAAGDSVELPVLGGLLDESLLACLSRVLAQNHDLPRSAQDIRFYLQRLRDSVPTKERVGGMDAAEMADYLAKLRQEKQ